MSLISVLFLSLSILTSTPKVLRANEMQANGFLILETQCREVAPLRARYVSSLTALMTKTNVPETDPTWSYSRKRLTECRSAGTIKSSEWYLRLAESRIRVSLWLWEGEYQGGASLSERMVGFLEVWRITACLAFALFHKMLAHCSAIEDAAEGSGEGNACA